jgi:hypothetical protein
MFEAGVVKKRVNGFWHEMPFDLEIDSEFGNCLLCFMKSTWKIKLLMALYPDKVSDWIAYEEMPRDRSNRFRKDRPSLRELWEQVLAGDMNAPDNDKECGTCGV